MKDIWEKFSIITGIILWAGSYYFFLSNGSPLTLIVGIFGALLFFNGVFEKGDCQDKFYYICIGGIITYFGAILAYIYIFKPVFLENPNFYFYTPLITLWIISFVFRYRKTKKYQRALEQYNKNLKLNPNDSIAWNNKGTALAELGEYKKAMECFNKSIELDPRNAAAWHNKAVSLTKRRKHPEARKYYDKSVELDATFALAKKAGNIVLKYGI